MAREIGELSAARVAKENSPGVYSDGGGLYLVVSTAGARSWIFRYSSPTVKQSGSSASGKPRNPKHGKPREMGLGATHTVSLAKARELARDARNLVQEKIDPIDQRDAARAAQATSTARSMTFDQCAEAYMAAHSSGWKNPKHAAQWKSTLATYASPVFGSLPAHAIDVTLVMKVIEPLWSIKPETAARLRGRIEAVLDWAKTRGYRAGENPARWKGHLDNLLPSRGKVAKVKHHPALPYVKLPAFMADLREKQGASARALEFTILTAARTGEAIGARWSEIDLAGKHWTIPAERMKSGRAHIVPLSDDAVAILKSLPAKDDGYVFAGARTDKPLSNMALLELLRGVRPGFTVHGFRSTFRDWAGDRTNYQRDVIEAALAHGLEDETEAAYRRSTAVDKRRRLMGAWAEFCSKAPATGKVIPMRSA
jgi:integrase